MSIKRDYVTFLKTGDSENIAEIKALSDTIFGIDSTTTEEFEKYYNGQTPISCNIAIKRKPPVESDKGQIIGFIIFQILSGEETKNLVPEITEKDDFRNDTETLKILKIGVLEEQRNKGIGKLLIENVKIKAEQDSLAKQIIVTVPKDDTSTIKYLLENYKTGFSEITTLTDNSVLYAFPIKKKG